jgi:DNA-binding FrmR family transcriptional regulator
MPKSKKEKHKEKDLERVIELDTVEWQNKRLDFTDEVKRLNRVIGQIEGIQKMLTAGRKLDDIVTQCKAVHSAINSVEQRVFKAHLDDVLHRVARLDKKKKREEIAEELEALFKKAS